MAAKPSGVFSLNRRICNAGVDDEAFFAGLADCAYRGRLENCRGRRCPARGAAAMMICLRPICRGKKEEPI